MLKITCNGFFFKYLMGDFSKNIFKENIFIKNTWNKNIIKCILVI